MNRARENRFTSGLRAFVDRNLPEEILAEDAATRRQARICVLLPFTGAIAAALALITQFALDRPTAGLIVSSIGVVVALSATQLVRVSQSVRFAGHVLTFLTFAFMSISVVIAGGLGTPRAFSLMLIPPIATLLVGWRHALFWLGAVTLAVLILLTLTFVGPDLAPDVEAVTNQRAHAAGVLIIMAITMFVIASYDRANSAVAEELEDALESADSANRLKDALVANVSHELRTPLNGVLGSADLLMRSGLDDTQRAHTETIETASEALLHLVDDLLDMSRLEAGGMELEAIPMRLRNMLGQVLAPLAPLAEAQAHVRLILHIDPDVPEHVVADPFRLRQVFTNLLNNAIKFTEEGHVVLRVSRAKGAIHFEVRDTGPGIAVEDRTRLFGAFEQAKASTARHHGGAGLGLNIAQRLVRLMGGTLELESELGVGTTFHFELALPASAEPQEPEEPLGGDEPAPYRVSLQISDDLEKAAAHAALTWAGHEITGPDEEADVIVHDAAERLDRWSVRIVEPSGLGGRSRREVRLARPFAPGRLTKAVWRAAHEAPSSRPPTSSMVGKGSVLVADDNLVNRRVARGQLAHLGYDAVLAETGLAALEEMQRAEIPFLGVFLDLRMPEMDGFEAAEKIREWERETGVRRTPIWALTAHEEAGQRRRATEAGFDRFYVKPLRIGDIDAIVEQHGAREELVTTPHTIEVVNEATWRDLTTLAEGDPEFLPKLLHGFIETSSRRLSGLRTSEEAETSELAHALKGASRQLGADALAEICERIEYHPEERDTLLAALEDELDRTRAALLERTEGLGG